MLLSLFLSSFAIGAIAIVLSICIVAQRLRKAKKLRHLTDNRFSVGVIHPFCDSGGGEDRILWSCLKALHARFPSWRYVIYTGEIRPADIIRDAETRFNIFLPPTIRVEFVYLRRRNLLDPMKSSYLSFIGLGSILVVFEALFKFVPDIYIDTMHCIFALPLFKYFGGCKVGCYVHSLLITRDFIQSLSYRSPSSSHASSPFVSLGRLLYYKIFRKFYARAGRCSDIIMANSSWTEAHINYLWECPSKTFRIYPPCCVEEMSTIPIVLNNGRGRHLIKIVSLSSFKIEKDHPQQLKTLFQLRQYLSEEDFDRVQLTVIGYCRNNEDQSRLKDMQDLCKHLSVEDNVHFKINISFDELKQELAQASIGIHTTFDDPFGISVVECMASGLIMIANKSGGPLMDIILEYAGFRNGFLANDELEYAEAIRKIIFMSSDDKFAIRNQARNSVERFGHVQFEKAFIEAIETLL